MDYLTTYCDLPLGRKRRSELACREGFKRPWPPLIKMDAAVKAKVGKLLHP